MPTDITGTVRQVVDEVAVCDIHTHLFDPGMGDLLLSGIDELLAYHYHVAELFRARPDLDPNTFFEMSTAARADLTWQELFVERAPASEVGRGVVALLQANGLDPNAPDLREAREFFNAGDLAERVDRTLSMARVSQVYMTNDPLDPAERRVWEDGFQRDPRFHAALRLDSALIDWPAPAADLQALGYDVSEQLTDDTISGVRRYLRDWIDRLDARYMAISLPPTFRYPDQHDATSQLIERAVMPTARDTGLPVALMIGVTRQVNPRLGLAGDAVGLADVGSVRARHHHDVRVLVTMLSRENQHELTVTARKFSNILPFGCWWFINNPDLVTELTAMRLDLLGLTFIPQHSDARVLEQLVFKWDRARALVGDVLAARYADLAANGWSGGEAEIRRDITRLFDGGLLG